MFDGEEYVHIPKRRWTPEFTALVSQISEAIYKYDPTGASPYGAPKDEYSGEAYSIAIRLRQAESETDVAKITVEVIEEACGIRLDRQAGALETVVHEIWRVWVGYIEK